MKLSFAPVAHRKIYFAITGILFAISIASLSVFGLKPGIDFTGGAIVEVTQEGEVSRDAVDQIFAQHVPAGYSIRSTSDGNLIVRTAPLDDAMRHDVVAALSEQGISVDRLNAIGPTLGSELAYKSIIAMSLVILSILIYVAIAFSGVREPVGSWTYGGIVVAALAHDLLLPLGLFSLLGQFAGYEIDTLFVTAMLVILGYSINDTIVIFDRIRENLRERKEAMQKGKEGNAMLAKEQFDHLVERSVRETLARSLNTTGTTAFALVVLYVVGAESTRAFSLALFAGVAAGAWSSIFFAAPLLVWFQKRAERRSN